MDHPIRGVNRPTDRGFANIEDEKCAISLLPLSNFGFVVHRLDNKVAGVVFRQPNFLSSLPLSAFLLIRSRPGGHQEENLVFLWQSKCRYQLLFKCLNTFTLGQKNFASYTFLFLHSNTFKAT